LAVRVLVWIAVVADVSRAEGVDAVVAAHGAVFAGVPRRAALAEDDVARYDVFALGDS
jgi:hypothetical protein